MNMEKTHTHFIIHRRWLYIVLTVVFVIALGIAYVVWQFTRDVAVAYDKIEEHFKYGSTGGERVLGFPYWIWLALPQVCRDKLPGEGYQSLGMIFEKDAQGNDKDLPVGVSKRRNMGIDRVFLNCAACHTSTVRATSDAVPMLVSGMPANTFNLMAFEKFFFACGKDPKFTPERIIPEIQRLGADLNFIERKLIYPFAIYLTQDRIRWLAGRFDFVWKQDDWGPGRVDTFNSAKANFNYNWDDVAKSELVGASDFPSIWNQQPRKGMQLHWDGNNKRVEERNLNAAFGTGATPPTIDHAAIERIEEWLLDFKPPPFPKEKINDALAQKGVPIYEQYCANCHGKNGGDFTGQTVGEVVELEKIGTDRGRLDSFTYDLSVNLATLYTGYDKYRFRGFRKTFGYANMPLDGVWLRAPYLHNGSVPTLYDLLQPSPNRPPSFYRGYDVYDFEKVGFVSSVPKEKGREFFEFKTSIPGNSNNGHEGARYGTELSAEEKAALIEHLKTF
jgi:mono/diheme cytochrome c family protein